MRRKISQREARRLRGRVQELEQLLETQRGRWKRDWPGGTNFWTTHNHGVDTMAALRTANALGRAVVVIPDSSENKLRFFAVNPDNP